MASVFDVAAYILNKQGPMTAMKLQKLCYYSQAWSLVWDERALFPNKIKAWANGPVIPALFHEHKGRYKVARANIEGDARHLDDDAKATIDAVLKFYGEMSSHELSYLTHMEAPWREARGDLGPEDKESPEIPRDQMAMYYESLTAPH